MTSPAPDASTRARLERILAQRERMLTNMRSDTLRAGGLRAEIHHLRTILAALS